MRRRGTDSKGHFLELPRYDVRSDMGFRPSERAIPRRDWPDGPEETDIPNGAGATRTGGDDYVGVQAVERGGDDKGDSE